MSVTRHRHRAPPTVRVGVVTVSDTRTPADDESGDLLRDLCRRAGHEILGSRLVPDDESAVRAGVRDLLSLEGMDVVLITGGTGLAGRDRTPEALEPLLDRRLEGFGELFRALSFEVIGPAAMLSRTLAGLAGARLVFALPGSPAAVKLALERLILPEIGHMVSEARRGS